MSEKGMEQAKRTLKTANTSNNDPKQSNLEEKIHTNEKIEEIKEMEEEKKSKATSSDTP